jgi:hypothetical protein
LAFLVGIAALIHADEQALAPNLAAIQKEFGVSEYDIGLMKGTFFIVGAIIGVLIGRKTDVVRELGAVSPFVRLVRAWRRHPRARDKLDITVPAGMPVISAISL